MKRCAATLLSLAALRLARGRARHPAQVVVTRTGNLRFDDGLMFQEPELRVFVITRTAAVAVVLLIVVTPVLVINIRRFREQEATR